MRPADKKCVLPVRAAQHGLGIIEVLVAVVVVSFGVLGMASLQLTGMKHSTSGYSRSKALLLAENMTTRMRINSPAVVAMQYAGFDSAAMDCNTKPAPYCQATYGGTASEICSSTELVAFDLFSVSCGDWGSAGAEEGAIGSLPNGKLEIECADAPCTATSAYIVSVTWVEGGETSAVADDNRRVQVRLRP